MVLKDSSETKVTFMQLGAMGRNQEVESVETYYDLDIGIATFDCMRILGNLTRYIEVGEKPMKIWTAGLQNFELTFVGSLSAAE